MRFFLTQLGEHKAILGYPWFAAMQPKIDWRWGWIDHTQLPIIFKAPDAMKANFKTIIRSLDTPKTKLPKEYAQHEKVFSEEKSQWLPKHTIWDHTIELLPGAPTTMPGRLLPLNQKEIEEMHKFVQEHLRRGTICESWSPYTANFFFVKKKDGKLQPVQDYRPVNKWTMQNYNVSPLIPQVINRLRGCTLFTKVDVRWGYNNIWIKEGWMESCLSHPQRAVQTNSDVLQIDELPSNLPCHCRNFRLEKLSRVCCQPYSSHVIPTEIWSQVDAGPKVVMWSHDSVCPKWISWVLDCKGTSTSV